MMTVLLHPHIIGRAGRTAWLEKYDFPQTELHSGNSSLTCRFLEYITSKEAVWVARRKDIAEHWTKTFPYDPKTAFGQTKVPECGQI
jgi:hypothetical protein